MIEKFSDFESSNYINKEGVFNFEVKGYELKTSSTGNPMAVFEVEAPEGKLTIRHTITANTKWSYNKLIKACLQLDTPEKIAAFELDYETIGQQLVGTHFLGTVEEDTYTKVVKKPNDDGTFSDVEETKVSYKIVKYDFAI